MTSIKRLQAELKFMKLQKKEVEESFADITDPFEKMMASKTLKIYKDMYDKTRGLVKQRTEELKKEKADLKETQDLMK